MRWVDLKGQEHEKEGRDFKFNSYKKVRFSEFYGHCICGRQCQCDFKFNSYKKVSTTAWVGSISKEGLGEKKREHLPRGSGAPGRNGKQYN